jgi:hypothetical protein
MDSSISSKNFLVRRFTLFLRLSGTCSGEPEEVVGVMDFDDASDSVGALLDNNEDMLELLSRLSLGLGKEDLRVEDDVV